MGTHPIFESDFDCLTEMSLFDIAKQNPFGKPVVSDAATSCEFGSTEYYLKCMIGGALSCGLTTPPSSHWIWSSAECRSTPSNTHPSARASRSPLPREVSKPSLEDGPPPSSDTPCREPANSVSTKSSRTSTETPWAKRTLSFTEHLFTSLLPLLPSSLPILPLLLWKLSRSESRPPTTPLLFASASPRCALKKATEPLFEVSSLCGCDRFHTQ